MKSRKLLTLFSAVIALTSLTASANDESLSNMNNELNNNFYQTESDPFHMKKRLSSKLKLLERMIVRHQEQNPDTWVLVSTFTIVSEFNAILNFATSRVEANDPGWVARQYCRNQEVILQSPGTSYWCMLSAERNYSESWDSLGIEKITL